MKLKSKTNVILMASFLLAGTNLRAQEVLADDSATDDNNSTNDIPTVTTKSNSGGIFRSGGDDGDFGGGGEDRKEDPVGKDEPIGGGILILSFLAGGYAILKRNTRDRHED